MADLQRFYQSTFPPRAGESRASSIENKTLYGTPQPIAASTEHKVKSKSQTMKPLHAEPPPNLDISNRSSFGLFSQDTLNRSSMGVLHNIDESSSSLVHVPASPTKTILHGDQTLVQSTGSSTDHCEDDEIDAEASIHEVQFNDDELKVFDASFSDCELDSTFTSEAADRLKENITENILPEGFFQYDADSDEHQKQSFSSQRDIIVGQADGEETGNISLTQGKDSAMNNYLETSSFYIGDIIVQDTQEQRLSRENVPRNDTFQLPVRTSSYGTEMAENPFDNTLSLENSAKDMLDSSRHVDAVFDKNGEFHNDTDQGQGVTDLAFKDIFEHEMLDLNQEEIDFEQIEFVPADDVCDMLNKDQKQFEDDNAFIPEAVVYPNSPQDANSSWVYKSYQEMANPSFMNSVLEDPARISIGTFLQRRTEVLGSLEGDAEYRPQFGSDFVSPPSSNRQPVALIETGVKFSGIQDDSHLTDVFDEDNDKTLVHGEGTVGNTTYLSHSSQSSESGKYSQGSERDSVLPENNIPNTTQLGDKTGQINISAINRAIMDTSSADSSHLAQMILKMSNPQLVNKNVPKKEEQAIKSNVQNKKLPVYNPKPSYKENILSKEAVSGKNQENREEKRYSSTEYTTGNKENKPPEKLATYHRQKVQNADRVLQDVRHNEDFASPNMSVIKDKLSGLRKDMDSCRKDSTSLNNSEQGIIIEKPLNDEQYFKETPKSNELVSARLSAEWSTPRPSSVYSRTSYELYSPGPKMSLFHDKGEIANYNSSSDITLTEVSHLTSQGANLPGAVDQFYQSAPIDLSRSSHSSTRSSLESVSSDSGKQKSTLALDLSCKRQSKHDKYIDEYKVGSSIERPVSQKQLVSSFSNEYLSVTPGTVKPRVISLDSVPNTIALDGQTAGTAQHNLMRYSRDTDQVTPTIGHFTDDPYNSYETPCTFTNTSDTVPASPFTFHSDRVHLRHGVYTTPVTTFHHSLCQRDIPGSGLTTPSRIKSIEVPMEIQIPGVCCIGLSTTALLPIQNPSVRWMQCIIDISMVNINGKEIDPGTHNPFVMKHKTIIEPGASEEIKVLFTPRTQGVYVSHVKIIASPIVSNVPLDSVPYMVAVKAMAEAPNIQVLYSDSSTIDFGEVPYSSQKALPITLINRGRSKVPLRLVISSNSKVSCQCFTFEQDTAMVSRSTRPSVPGMGRTILNFIIPGCTEDSKDYQPNHILVYFHAPTKNTGTTPSMPDEYSARLDIEVDSPINRDVISFVQLRALAGLARLHVPRSLDNLVLSAMAGGTDQKSFPLRNAGNISIKVSCSVTNFQDLFIVMPSEFEIHPGYEREVAVIFSPNLKSQSEYKSDILMFVEPNGPGYEMSVVGCLAMEPPLPTLKPQQSILKKKANLKDEILMANKHFLSWGGIPIGRSLQQKVMLYNNSNEVMKLRLQIKTKNDAVAFQLQTVCGDTEKLCSTRELILKVYEEYPVCVLFSPNMVKTFLAKLEIRPILKGRLKYTIPLSGYGGICKLSATNVKSGNFGSHWINVGPVDCGKNLVTKITVKNDGTRAGYVKAIAYTDIACKHQLSTKQVIVQPSEFVLHHSENKDIMVVLNPSEREAALCSDMPQTIGAIAFFHGDEIQRQKYRKSRKQGLALKFKLNEDNPLKNVEFDVYYVDENTVPEDKELPNRPNDVELFYSTLSRVTLALVGEPSRNNKPPYLRESLQPLLLDESTATDIGHSEDMDSSARDCDVYIGKSESPPTKGTPAPQHVLADCAREFGHIVAPTLDKSWAIDPQQVILTAQRSVSVKQFKRVSIMNYTDVDSRFELSWPAHCLTVTPEQGTIPARSSIVLCLSPSIQIFNKESQVPWSGALHVSFNGQTKTVKVQIREDMSAQDSLDYPVLDDNVGSNGTIAEVAQIEIPVSDQSAKGRCLKLANYEVSFPATAIGESSEATVDVSNTTSKTLMWALSSLAPTYVKSSVASSDVYRVTYTAFKLNKKSGSIESGQHMKIPVVFLPREVGIFSQYWDLESAGSDSTRVHFYGMGIRENAHNSKQAPNRSGIVIKSDLLHFPITPVGKRSICKVKLENSDRINHRIEVIMPQLPFTLKNLKLIVRAKHYTTLPVEFRPTFPGKFTSLLVLRTDLGDSLSVQLQGDTLT